MRRLPGRLHSLLLGLALTPGLAAGAADLVFEVQNNQYERFRHPVHIDLTPQQVAQIQERRLAEVDAEGQALGLVASAVDASGEKPVLAWVTPGITDPGALRRFAFLPKQDLPDEPAPGTDLTVEVTDTHIVVANTYFEVRHPRKGGGGFPDRIVFRLSGHQEDKFRFLDRLYRRKTGCQYTAQNDPKASARVAFRSPVRVVVESTCGHYGAREYAPGNVRAVYRYAYSPFRPVIDVSCVATRDDEELWNELHFMQPSRADFHYTRFVIGEPPEEKPMLSPGEKSRGHHGRHWGLLATDDDALGVGFGGATCWDAADEYYYYTNSACTAWETRRCEFEGGLYVGPAVGDLSWYSRWLGPGRDPQVRPAAATGAAAEEEAEPTVVGAYELANDALRIVFADPAGGFDCLAVDNRLVGGVRFVHPRDDEPGLWRLEFRPAYEKPAEGEKKGKPDEGAVILTNRDEAKPAAQPDPVGRKLTLTWKGLDLPEEADVVDVTVVVALADGAGPSQWRIDIDNRSKRFGLWEVQFPFLTTVCRKGTADVLLPRGNWGGSLYKNSRAALNHPYPSAACPVQFMAFNRGQAGLYLAAHDGGARAKRLVVTADQDATFATYAEDMGVPGSDVAAPFPVVIAGYRGNWWEAARIYRKWALQQEWTRKGWIRDRADIPLHFKELGVWMLGGGMPKDVRKWMLDAEKFYTPPPVGLHWYNWHKIPFDHSYPEYFPTKPDFDKVVRELVGRGQVMMPYINGRLWDRDIPSFETGVKGSCKERSGEPYTEMYGSGRRLAPMCPTTKIWQDKVNEIMHGLIHDCGVNAVYLDQIGAARPRLCFDAAHGHPLGGGRWWVDGYRVLMDRVKAQAAANNVALTTENTAEPYMDNIEGFLTWSARFDTDVPVLPAVYSGYTVYYSSPQDAGDSLDAFVMAQGRDFLWGCQLGWNGTWTFAEKHRRKGEFMKRLAQYRIAAKEFFVYGQLLDEVRFDEPVGTVIEVWRRRKPHPATLPAVMGTLWRAADGGIGVFLINFDSAPRRVAYTVDPARWGSAPGPKGWLISRLNPGGAAPWIACDQDAFRWAGVLSGHEVLALSIEPAADLKDAAKRARQVAGGPGGDPVLKEAATALLFSQALRDRKLEVRVAEEMFTVARGDPAEISVRVANAGRRKQTVRVAWSDGRSGELMAPGGETAELTHTFWPEAADGEVADASLEVSLGKGGLGQVRRYPVAIKIVPPVAVTMGTVLQARGGESFLLPIEVRNNSRTARPGRIELKVPSGWEVEPAVEFDLGRMQSGDRRDLLVKCRAPQAKATTVKRIEARFVEQTGGIDIKVLKSRPAVDAASFAKPPRIDGNLDEWGAPPAFELGGKNSESVKISKEYGGAADCSACVRVGWDRTNFYLAAEVTDNVLHQQEEGYQLWQGDCLQLAFRNPPPNRAPAYDGSEFEVGLAKGPNGPVLFRWMPDGKPLKQGALAVVRDGVTTRYEAAVPWSAIGVTAAGPSVQVTWSLTVNDNDGKGFRGWLEWTPGVCGGKDSSAFGWLRLAK